MGQRMLQLTISILLALNLGCSRLARVTALQNKDMPTVTVGQGKLGFVHFPGDFTRKDPEPGVPEAAKIITTLNYEVRRPAGSSNELIFAMKDSLDEKGNATISDDFYAVTLDGQFKTRRASLEEWKSAHVLPSVNQNNAVIGSPVTSDKDGVSYNSKHYPIQPGSASTETKSFLSPSKKWLVVLSDDSKPANRPGIPGFSGGGRTEGHMFIDIYDTKSGEKIFAGRAPHSGGAAGAGLFSESLWIGDSYFVVALDPPGEDRGSVGQDCFLAILSP
jgi:hypothetical protein